MGQRYLRHRRFQASAVKCLRPMPRGGKSCLFQTLPPHIRGGGAPTNLGGGFNCISNIFVDKLGGDSQAGPMALKALTDLLRDFNLIDIFRSMHPSARKFTWTNSKVSSRLDKFYVSPDISANTKHCEIKVFPFSDHDAPFLSFKLDIFATLWQRYLEIQQKPPRK